MLSPSQALLWVQSMGFSNVVFELDCKGVVDSVIVPRADISVFGNIVAKCSRILSFFFPKL